jgi:1,4-dihydroxy-6-naphthoate synthase
MTLDFGYSPCPNDTFMFWAWAHGRVPTDLDLRPRLEDIQELNRLALAGAPLALSKISASTYLDPRVRERYRLLDVGAALGRGCGPLVVSKAPWSISQPTPLKLAVPGLNTTAYRLARGALSEHVSEWIEMRYDEIMPATLQGKVDAGVIIHESRFTYQGLGLHLALDLGQWWEQRTGLPLPLGVMVARRDVDQQTVAGVEQALSQSLRQAWKLFRSEAQDDEVKALWSYLRDNAIELDDATMAAHIDLYVNDYSLDLGDEGRAALERFATLPL